ncbi:hypothetical protein MYSTI_01182 [Myxococcus stipitatus DSM 14675]|uniref:Lipoprotein n=1 Tax=Myxococcus stipitatus (strain DSM 14675 / JCM 12634 / Mx s8) TaxID=1278073 RepID=L7U3V4_MYXSD|nr:hypothetical protein [Myxococcus stipitatus]AGC42530.1 hypothetical protein MYSTI_01182 [Myxococcus stipitatus DSM 14675]
MRRYVFVMGTLAWLTACSGSGATDSAVCQDVVSRYCESEECPQVADKLLPGEGCAASLLERTGCGAEDFAFSTPTRERMLECRTPFVQATTSTGRPPSCADAAGFIEACPDVAAFFRGEPPPP